MNVMANTIKLANTSFLESVPQFHLFIIYGHFSFDIKSQYNHLRNTACRLSKGQLEVSSIDYVFELQFKTKCLKNVCYG